jgi:Flp pilus assembly protein TadD
MRAKDAKMMGAKKVCRRAFQFALSVTMGVSCAESAPPPKVAPGAKAPPKVEQLAPSPLSVGPASATTAALAASSAPQASATLGPKVDSLFRTSKSKSDFPPEQSSVIPLSFAASDAEGFVDANAALLDGDKVVESDAAAAKKAYSRALVHKRTRARAKVGLLRVRLAGWGFQSEYAGAKSDARVIALHKELKAVAAEESSGPVLAELGRVQLLLGEATTAEATLTKALTELGSVPEVASLLGVAKMATGKVQDALAQFQRARDLDAGSSARQGNFATALMLAGQPENALEPYEFQAVLAQSARAFSDLGTCLASVGDLKTALRALEKAVQLEPSRATFRSNFGYVHEQLGNYAEAIAAYQEATRLDPTLISAWLNLTTVYARSPATCGKAREALARAEALDKNDPRVVANAAEMADLRNKGKCP